MGGKKLTSGLDCILYICLSKNVNNMCLQRKMEKWQIQNSIFSKINLLFITVLLRIFWTYQFPRVLGITKNILRMFSKWLETPEIQNYSRKRKLKYIFSQIRINFYIILFSITLEPGRCLFVCLFFISLQIIPHSVLRNFNFHLSPQHNPLL